jgi:hypothetical protein
MSILRCDCCGRPVDTDYEGETRAVATGQEDWVFLCAKCSEIEAAEANLYLEQMQQMVAHK